MSPRTKDRLEFSRDVLVALVAALAVAVVVLLGSALVVLSAPWLAYKVADGQREMKALGVEDETEEAT